MVDPNDNANRASIILILDDFMGYEDMERYNMLRLLAERWISETTYTNYELNLAIAHASDGYQLAKGTYPWPESA